MKGGLSERVELCLMLSTSIPPIFERSSLSILLLAVTNELSLDIAVVPFLWVFPLVVYLLTFIIAFDSERWYRRVLVLPACIAASVFLFCTTWIGGEASFSYDLSVWLIVLFLFCLFCHGEVVRLKPTAEQLTKFYLYIAAGGALGGLFVGTGFGGQREYLAMNKGDAVLHRSTLLHGVQVYDLPNRPKHTERWSWILWYRDSISCQDHSHEWFVDCAQAGDPLCQQLHSTKVGNVPGLSSEEIAGQIMDLNIRAAKGGAGTAAAKVARAYLKQLPSSLPFDVQQAKRYYQMAINSNNPEGHYGMASLLLASALLTEQKAGNGSGSTGDIQEKNTAKVTRAVLHLEKAAMAGHVFSMFNLGIVHTFGYGTPNGKIDTDLAADWFVASGLPEGYEVASHQAASVGDAQKQRLYEEQAKILGFRHPWRKAARQHTGSGGAGGVDLNLQWPTSSRGVRPPQF